MFGYSTTRAVRHCPRVLAFIYGNPGAYPPLEHSAHLLVGQGADVHVIGINAIETSSLELAAAPGLTTELLPGMRPGWKQKLHYAQFCWRVARRALAYRPTLLHASDPLAALAALIASFVSRAPIMYHEHDALPNADGAETSFMTVVRWARARIVREARLVIVPQEQRLRRLQADVGRRDGIVRVWNCPLSQDGLPEPEHRAEGLHLLYHGSIVPDRLPRAVLQALRSLPSAVHLHIVGYAPSGTPGYVKQLEQAASHLGIADRVHFVGPIPHRRDMLAYARRCHVGLSLMPMEATDPNLRFMIGASNKPFDYMACGLALLVADLDDWRAMYVEPGYARACDPRDSGSIATEILWYLENRHAAALMGEAGRQRIAEEWNYEHEFTPVARLIAGCHAQTIPSPLNYGEPSVPA